MQIDFNVPIKDIRGEIVKEEGKDLTLSSVACNALLLPYQDEQSLDAKEKVTRFKLASKIVEANGEAVNLSVEEVAELKKLIGKAYAPLIVGRAFEILDV